MLVHPCIDHCISVHRLCVQDKIDVVDIRAFQCQHGCDIVSPVNIRNELGAGSVSADHFIAAFPGKRNFLLLIFNDHRFIETAFVEFFGDRHPQVPIPVDDHCSIDLGDKVDIVCIAQLIKSLRKC